MSIIELDRPLNFHGNSEIKQQPFGSRNTATIGVDQVVYQAANKPSNNAGTTNGLKSDFGSIGGPAASKYNNAVRKLLHHESEYAPCKTIYPKE